MSNTITHLMDLLKTHPKCCLKLAQRDAELSELWTKLFAKEEGWQRVIDDRTAYFSEQLSVKDAEIEQLQNTIGRIIVESQTNRKAGE